MTINPFAAAMLLATIMTRQVTVGVEPPDPRLISSIFDPTSTPASSIYSYALFILAICAVIFVVVSTLLVYAVVRYRRRHDDDGSEPSQVYGSGPIELAWTVIPVLIVVLLSLTTARTIQKIQDAPLPRSALEVTVIGRQWWWEFRYPQLGIVTANELHVPVSRGNRRRPTSLTLRSADVAHSFWIPRLNGKTDLIPNRVNRTWIEPREVGLYVGQCAEYCGTQHAKMLLRVYVHEADDFEAWVRQQKAAPPPPTGEAAEGRRLFEATACVSCHTVGATVADGTFGPDLTHLMSRETLASGAVPNTPENLRTWIKNPDALKPGALMPAMSLSEGELDQIVAYLLTLR
jgi:cytochrome c oxidase subunit 2